MKLYIIALLAAISYAQTGCECVAKWEFKGATYSGCDPAAPKDKQPWCYVSGSGCPDAKESTVKSGEFWRYCQADASSSSGAIATDSHSVTHMVVVSGPVSGSSAVPAGAGAAAAKMATDASIGRDPQCDSMGCNTCIGREGICNGNSKEQCEAAKTFGAVWCGIKTEYSGSGNPNEPPADASAASDPVLADFNTGSDVTPGAAKLKKIADREAEDGHGDFKPLHKTMSEGRLLRKLWAEMNQIEALIHAANVDLKKRLIEAFKVVRTRMVEWEKMKDDTSGKKTEGQRLRGMWAAMGAIEDEIHEINIAMKKRLQGLIKALRAKMGIFDAAAARIDRMRKAQGKSISPPGANAAEEAGKLKIVKTGGLSEGSFSAGKPGYTPSGPCPPGEVAIAGAEGSVSCSPPATADKAATAEKALAVPSWRRHLGTAESMAPLVRTVSEGAKLRALWAELGGIEKEIHETNLVLKARLLTAFKVIRARMANWEKEKNLEKKQSEGQRLRAQWAELGSVEEEIHITNQEMKRRLRKVIRVIKEKMHHFNKGAKEADMLKNQQNPNRPGRSHKKVPALSESESDSLE